MVAAVLVVFMVAVIFIVAVIVVVVVVIVAVLLTNRNKDGHRSIVILLAPVDLFR